MNWSLSWVWKNIPNASATTAVINALFENPVMAVHLATFENYPLSKNAIFYDLLRR